MVPDIFHRDFNPIPYWWEAYTPTTGELVEVPRATRVAIVGGGYAGLSTALELAKHGIDAVVLEAGRARLWRQHPQWRSGQRRRQYRQELHRAECRCRARAGRAVVVGRVGRLWPH